MNIKRILLCCAALVVTLQGFAQTAERLVGIRSEGYGNDPSYIGWHELENRTFKYIGSNGSYFNYNSMGYNYRCITDRAEIPFDIIASGTPLFDFFSYAPNVMYSRMSVNYPASVYISLDTTNVTYTTSGNMTFVYDTAFAANGGRAEQREYDGAGRLVKKIGFGHQASYDVFDTIFQQFYVYNADNRLVYDSSVWKWSYWQQYRYINRYAYSASGNISTAKQLVYYDTILQYGYRYEYSYDAEAHPKKKVCYRFPDNLLMEVDSFGWEPGINYYTFQQQTIYNDTGLIGVSVITKHVSPVLLLPDTVVSLYHDYYSLSGGRATGNRAVFEYNTVNDPITQTVYGINEFNGIDSLAEIVHYTYKPYASSSISTTTTGTIHIYPNPADGRVTLDLPEMINGAQVEFSDMTGRVVLSAHITGNAQASFDVKQLPAGTYVVRVSGNGTQLVGKTEIAR